MYPWNESQKSRLGIATTGIFHLIIVNTASGGSFDMFYSPLPDF
jgi:hypothetical protein